MEQVSSSITSNRSLKYRGAEWVRKGNRENSGLRSSDTGLIHNVNHHRLRQRMKMWGGKGNTCAKEQGEQTRGGRGSSFIWKVLYTFYVHFCRRVSEQLQPTLVWIELALICFIPRFNDPAFHFNPSFNVSCSTVVQYTLKGKWTN